MIRINLNREASPAALTSARYGRVLLVVAILGGVLTATQVALVAGAATLTERRDALRLEIARQQAEALRQSSTKPATSADEGLATSTDVATRLRRIAAAVPGDLWLLGYRELGGEATMRGMASSDEAARVFVENLAASAAFWRLEITETATDGGRESEPGVQEFSLKGAVHGDTAATGVTGAGS